MPVSQQGRAARRGITSKLACRPRASREDRHYPSRFGPSVPVCRRPAAGPDGTSPQSIWELRSHPSPTAPSAVLGDRRGGRSVENAPTAEHCSRLGTGPQWQPSASNIAPFKFPAERCRCAEYRPGDLDKTSPHSIGAELRFPPFAHRAFGCLGDRRRGRSVENARPLSLWSGSVRQPDCVSRTSSEADPRRHGRRPLRDQWHGVDGVIHALSTATIPRQSSRGGQSVGDPHDDLGRSPFRLSRTPPVPKHRPIQSARAVRRRLRNTVDIYSI